MQTAATEFAEVLKFRFDADIEAADGEAQISRRGSHGCFDEAKR